VIEEDNYYLPSDASSSERIRLLDYSKRPCHPKTPTIKDMFRRKANLIKNNATCEDLVKENETQATMDGKETPPDTRLETELLSSLDNLLVRVTRLNQNKDPCNTSPQWDLNSGDMETDSYSPSFERCYSEQKESQSQLEQRLLEEEQNDIRPNISFSDQNDEDIHVTYVHFSGVKTEN
jgi:hypothetical protein